MPAAARPLLVYEALSYSIEQNGACTQLQDPPKPRLGVWSAVLRFEMNKGDPAFGGLAEVEGRFADVC
jgi:hypothetical protein